MSTAEILEKLPNLTPAERQEIRARLNELEGVKDEGWDDNGDLTDADKKLLADRMADFEKNPLTSIPWAEAEAQLKARWGE